MDSKQACDKLNGFNFQNRYLVGMLVMLPCLLKQALSMLLNDWPRSQCLRMWFGVDADQRT